MKLAAEPCQRTSGDTAYILDEPTTGLHLADVEKLVTILHRLADAGNAVIVIEHNLDIIKVADHVIDLGPDAGDAGGFVVANGTPEAVARVAESHTGRYLAPLLNRPVIGAAALGTAVGANVNAVGYVVDRRVRTVGDPVRLSRRPLGRTGIQVSPLVLAGGSIRGANPKGPQLTPEDVERAYHDHGVNTFLVVPSMKAGSRQSRERSPSSLTLPLTSASSILPAFALQSTLRKPIPATATATETATDTKSCDFDVTPHLRWGS